MLLNRSKLYILLLSACSIGYIWLFYISKSIHSKSNALDVCLFKNATNIPCPSCGSTRSVISIFQGDFTSAIYTNPFGLIIAGIMLFVPLWIFMDLILKKKTFFEFYIYTESNLKRKSIAIPLLIIVLINWIWNVTKGL